VAVVASLGRFPLPTLASVAAGAPKRTPAKPKTSHKAAPPAAPKPAPPPPPPPVTVPAATADRLLDQIGEVVGKLFFLASHDDLEVNVWFGSTPETKVAFSFWPAAPGQAPPSRMTVRTNGRRDHVLRGEYSYEAAWIKKAVTQKLVYVDPGGAASVSSPGEELDLVDGSSFFCCRFKEGYCHHVESEQECRS